MKKASVLLILIGFALITMLSGCQNSNSRFDNSSVINNSIVTGERNSSQADMPDHSSSESIEMSSESSSTFDSSSDINNSVIESENSSSQTDISDPLSPESDETSSESNSSDNYNSSSPDDNSDDNKLEFGNVDIIDGLLELDSEGQARGEIEAGHKIDYRKATLAKGSSITFNVNCKQELTYIKITLTERKTEERLEGNVISKGELTFEIESGGEYVVTIENCSQKGTYFTIEYRISDNTVTV